MLPGIIFAPIFKSANWKFQWEILRAPKNVHHCAYTKNIIIKTRKNMGLNFNKIILIFGFLSLLHAAYSAVQRKLLCPLQISNNSVGAKFNLKLFFSRPNLPANHRTGIPKSPNWHCFSSNSQSCGGIIQYPPNCGQFQGDSRNSDQIMGDIFQPAVFLHL